MFSSQVQRLVLQNQNRQEFRCKSIKFIYNSLHKKKKKNTGLYISILKIICMYMGCKEGSLYYS